MAAVVVQRGRRVALTEPSGSTVSGAQPVSGRSGSGEPVEPARVVVFADSLAFYGPTGGELVTDSRLFPNVAAARMSMPSRPVVADVVARVGWTARDVWWSMTRDPLVYSILLARADAVVLAVGGMDYLPTTVPTWLREGIRYLRPPAVRRVVRSAYQRSQPVAARVTPWRALPQRLTDEYLDRCVGGVRYFHPGVPVVGILPPPHRAPAYGASACGAATDEVSTDRAATCGAPADGASGEQVRGYAGAVAAARRWGRRQGVPMLDLPGLVGPALAAGDANPDGMHYGWRTHAAIGEALANCLVECGLGS